MSKKSGIWIGIMFIVLPLAYYLTFVSSLIVGAGGKPLNYLVLILSCVIIIYTNVIIIKKISKK